MPLLRIYAALIPYQSIEPFATSNRFYPRRSTNIHGRARLGRRANRRLGKARLDSDRWALGGPRRPADPFARHLLSESSPRPRSRARTRQAWSGRGAGRIAAERFCRIGPARRVANFA